MAAKKLVFRLFGGHFRLNPVKLTLNTSNLDRTNDKRLISALIVLNLVKFSLIVAKFS